MKFQQLTRGMVRQWCYDLGGASFLGSGLIGLVMAFGISFDPRLEPLTILLGLTIISSAIACGWQLNRISASEEAQVIPGYIDRVLFQCLFVTVLAVLLSILVLFNAGMIELIGLLGAITSWGMAFIYLCTKWPKGFFLAIFAYLIMPWLPDVYESLENQFIPAHLLVWLAVPVLGMLIYQHYQSTSWHSDARSVYLNGSEMGFYWMPQISGNPLLSWFDRQLHPVSFFVGPMLTMTILIYPCLMLVISIVAWFMKLDLPVYLILLQGLVIACSLVHWSRIQRWRSVELLMVLPGYVGREGMRKAFFAAQNRLIAMVTVAASITICASLMIQGEFKFDIWLHLSFASFWGAALILGLGAACRTAMHISLTIFIVILVTAIQMGSLESLLEKESYSLIWLAIDVVAGLLALGALKWGSLRLWSQEEYA